MATFSWTATAGAGTLTDAWNDTASWSPTPTPTDFSGGSSNDFIISLSANLRLTNFGNNQHPNLLSVNGANEAFFFVSGAVNSGTVNFLGGSGLLVLLGSQVGDGTNLSNGTFGATISGLTNNGLNTLGNGIDIAAANITSVGLSGVNNDI